MAEECSQHDLREPDDTINIVGEFGACSPGKVLIFRTS